MNKVGFFTKLRWKIGIFKSDEVQDFMEISYSKGLKDGVEKGKTEATQQMSKTLVYIADQKLKELMDNKEVNNDPKI